MNDTNNKQYPAPFSFRVSAQEKETLKEMAGDQPIGAFLRDWIFNGRSTVSPPRKKVRAPVKDEEALSQLMGMLGQSRIPQNINQLAKAANSGSLPVSPDVEKKLIMAARAVMEMRRLNLQALGHSAE